MIGEISIFYKKSEAVTFCFWKYFLQSCGIGVMVNEINKDWFNTAKNGPYLLILGKEDCKYILSQKQDNCVYLVKRNSEYQRFTNRSDVFPVGRWSGENKNKDIFSKVLKVLLENVDSPADTKQIQGLLRIFIEENLWSAFWLYHEMAFQEASDLDGQIVQNCDKASNRLRTILQSGNEWHTCYMRLYCDYIKSGTSTRSFMKRTVICENLLMECREISSIYGWQPPLCILAGKICGLSRAENKYAIYYYQSALKINAAAELLYNVGQVYEDIYGDSNSALKYYIDAYQTDRNYFRAIYKIARSQENEGRWMTAFTLYNKIIDMLSGVDWVSAISIRELEYFYKAIKKAIHISSLNINDINLVEQYHEQITQLFSYIQDGKAFSKTFRCILDKRERDKVTETVLERLRKKLEK